MSPPSDRHRPFGSLMPTHRNVTGPKSGVNSAESEGAAINTANGTQRLEMDLESCQIKARSLPRNACITLGATEPRSQYHLYKRFAQRSSGTAAFHLAGV